MVRFLFYHAGYFYDDETGLYYLNARMYDPKIARFLQEDTYRGSANDPLSLNLYTYCHNEPIMYTDPTGHWGGRTGERDDSKLTSAAQKKIVQATNDYYNAKTPQEKEAAHQRAEDVRNDPNSYPSSSSKSSSKSSNKSSSKSSSKRNSKSNDSSDNSAFIAAANLAMSNGPMSKDEWNAVNTIYQNSSKSTSDVNTKSTRAAVITLDKLNPNPDLSKMDNETKWEVGLLVGMNKKYADVGASEYAGGNYGSYSSQGITYEMYSWTENIVDHYEWRGVIMPGSHIIHKYLDPVYRPVTRTKEIALSNSTYQLVDMFKQIYNNTDDYDIKDLSHAFAYELRKIENPDIGDGYDYSSKNNSSSYYSKVTMGFSEEGSNGYKVCNTISDISNANLPLPISQVKNFSLGIVAGITGEAQKGVLEEPGTMVASFENKYFETKNFYFDVELIGKIGSGQEYYKYYYKGQDIK